MDDSKPDLERVERLGPDGHVYVWHRVKPKPKSTFDEEPRPPYSDTHPHTHTPE